MSVPFLVSLSLCLSVSLSLCLFLSSLFPVSTYLCLFPLSLKIFLFYVLYPQLEEMVVSDVGGIHTDDQKKSFIIIRGKSRVNENTYRWV